MTCEMLLRDQLRNSKSISLLSSVLGVELVSLGMHFDNCGSLRAPVPGLLVSLGIDVEFEKEVLDITLVISGHTSRLEVLS